MKKYLKNLTELHGAPGNEEKVREFIKNEIKDKVDEIYEDVMGNLITKIKGKSSEKKLMISAHMDEVGFLITKINEDGTFNISPSGGVDPRVVRAQRLLINGELPAIVNQTPIHLDHDIQKVQGYDSIKVFAGFTKKEEAKNKVKLGDMVTFDVKYYENEDFALCKAFDDRVGCSIMMDIIDNIKETNENPQYDTYFCFVTQEEAGLRGSGVAAEYVKPDVALVLEGTTAGDNPELEPEKWATHLNDGPVITFMHSGVVLKKEVYEEIIKTAKDLNIKYQYKMRTAGGTDAARFARTMYGIPSGVISVPCRYIHSANSIINLKDYERVYKLSNKLIMNGRIAEL
ncbi:endoglucanase [Tepiditoga spiralis]|uniref:Endoglucanase n=1 Tax=Tepiditoga spiralis TaxID=2108365 RepID=A0A7G1G8C0_9BACT|nr:M20/M25/M40 family metallo-hydrolase [Tepiditoga spiralis]BBE31153.1 endoglucanase [Tepiditoga spiralis]